MVCNVVTFPFRLVNSRPVQYLFLCTHGIHICNQSINFVRPDVCVVFFSSQTEMCARLKEFDRDVWKCERGKKDGKHINRAKLTVKKHTHSITHTHSFIQKTLENKRRKIIK